MMTEIAGSCQDLSIYKSVDRILDGIRSPIVLFVYNRPEHTRLTIDALQKNELAKESNLFIFSDAPKTPQAAASVRMVREYIRTIDGFKSVNIIERSENMGLSNSIIDGVTTICNKFGRVVVLEDDLVTSPYFLRFMNDALDLYEHQEKVISIHGYVYPVGETLPETFFLRGADCWGWGTWQRGWDLFERDGKQLFGALKKDHLENGFNFGGGYDYIGMLHSQIRGKNDSWAIRWYASAYLNDKLTLYPGNSLVLNIGMDGSGKHCGTTGVYSTILVDDCKVNIGGIAIEDNLYARSSFATYFYANKISLVRKVLRRIKFLVGKIF